MRPFRLVLCVAVLAAFTGCPGGDDDDSTGGIDGPVDILFVVDNSSSMEDEQQTLGIEFSAFLGGLAGVDYQIAVTTTDVVSPGNGNQGNARSAAGVGGATCEEPRILRPDDGDVAGAFADLVDVGIGGAGDETGALAAAFALCKGQAADFWGDLEARPDDDPVRVLCSLVPISERATGDTPPCNADATGPLFRPGATPVVIVISDEGDGAAVRNDLPPPDWLTRCVDDNASNPNVGSCDCRVEWYASFFAGLPTPALIHSIAPSYQIAGDVAPWCDGGNIAIPGPCNEFGSSSCSLDLYQQLACQSGGSYHPLEENVGGVTAEDPPECREANFEDLLAEIAAAIAG